MITIPLWIALIVSAIYLLAVKRRTKGVLRKSISKTAYIWKGTPMGIWNFIGFLTVVSWAIMISVGMYIQTLAWESLTTLQQLGFASIMLGGFLIWVVGCFADFLPGGFVEYAHLAGSYGGIGLPLLFGVWAAFGLPYLAFTAAFIILVVITKKKGIKNLIFWVETEAIYIGIPALITAILISWH